MRRLPTKHWPKRCRSAAGNPIFCSLVLHFENDEPVQLEQRWINPAVAPEYALQHFTNTTPNQYLVRVAPLQRVEYRVKRLRRLQTPCIC